MVKAVSDAAVLSVREMVETALDKQDLAPLVIFAAWQQGTPVQHLLCNHDAAVSAHCNHVV